MIRNIEFIKKLVEFTCLEDYEYLFNYNENYLYLIDTCNTDVYRYTELEFLKMVKTDWLKESMVEGIISNKNDLNYNYFDELRNFYCMLEMVETLIKQLSEEK